MREVYVVAAVRTPIGKFGGVFKDVSPVDLGAHAMREALARAGVEGKALDLYIFGNVLRAGHGQLLPRQAALKAGIPKEVDGYQVDMVCASGMMAALNAVQFLRTGEAHLVLAGGMESMSQAGFYLSHRARWGYKFLLGAPENLQDILLRDGLSDPFTGEAMGEQAERLAQDHGVTRQEIDEAAYLSHKRAAEATEKGLFAWEIAPVEVQGRKGPVVVDRDEGIRPETTLESLAALRPAFKEDGVLTAGNSSQISDGAAALLLGDREKALALGLRPRARFLARVVVAGDPTLQLLEVIPAAKKALERAGLSLRDVDVIEVNEAFASVVLAFLRELGADPEKVNPNGGAIAHGHPLGATGAVLMTKLLYELERTGGEFGLQVMCIGHGQATATVIQRL